MGFTHPHCMRRNGIDGFITIFQYNNFLKKVIKTIKYRLASDILSELIFIAKQKIFTSLDFFLKSDKDIVFQAIPLHDNRLKERGFNQADLIIKNLNEITPLFVGDYLTRLKNTSPQAQIHDKNARFNNMRGAFAPIDNKIAYIQERSFFLVDDVVTTGSTVKEAAQTLKKNNAAKIFVFSLAKG